MSPWVATTFPSFTPTMTPQPVPQKRHGAFDHCSWMSGPAGRFCAEAGRLTFAAAAAAAAACALMNARRERSMVRYPWFAAGAGSAAGSK
jgi:hypothetical protein